MQIARKFNLLARGVCLAFLVVSGVQANPGGASVVHGSVTFSQPNSNTLNVTNTPGAIINWQQFGIDQGEITRFIQQSSNSTVLNRIIGQDPSTILGQLNSNGKVFLVNPNGIIFGKDAVVNTAGLISSTLDISNQDFLDGRMHFADLQNAAEILNQGFISASDGGEVVFVAPKITNEGVISVDNGHIVLAAGQSVTINSLNYDNIEFEVQAPDNKVVNLGEMITDGGSVGVFAGSIVSKGTVSANAVTMDDAGNIIFVAQTDTVIEDGTVTASSRAGKGGHIQITGERVALLGETTVDASGTTGGGEVLIGGDNLGNNPSVKNASATVIGSNVAVKADALSRGDGGKVIVWSDVSANIQGKISATGGNKGGDGGFVETSAKQNLEITATPDVTAKYGKGGEWLIDPNDITIFDVGATTTNISTTDPFLSFGDGAFLQVGLITTALSGGANVTITTGTGGTNLDLGDINLNAVIDLDNTIGTNTLTLSAHNDININADIQDTVPGGQTLNLVLIADNDASGLGNINLGANIELGGGNLTLDTPKTVSMTSGIVNVGSLSVPNSATSVSLSGGSFTINNVSTINGFLTLSGASLNITGTTLNLNGGLAWTASSTIAGGGTGSLFLPAGKNLSVSAPVSTLDGVLLDNSGNIAFSGTSSLDLINGT
ncbi:MAG TPA: filamentous hemagglutinin N-terminal domain-containing protein, partial [Gammaproteobacteria bacterium]|nr:filamentous hemagglutinin N-terminal domain-containing protein [Gammaproteobacteria bacterium]